MATAAFVRKVPARSLPQALAEGSGEHLPPALAMLRNPSAAQTLDRAGSRGFGPGSTAHPSQGRDGPGMLTLPLTVPGTIRSLLSLLAQLHSPRGEQRGAGPWMPGGDGNTQVTSPEA